VGAIKILEKPSSIFQPLPLLPKSAVYKKEGKMKFPCEIMVWVVLPGIRAAVAEELIKKGLKAQFSAGCEKGDKKNLLASSCTLISVSSFLSTELPIFAVPPGCAPLKNVDTKVEFEGKSNLLLFLIK